MDCAVATKVAVAVSAAVSVTVHAAVPEHAPLHPSNVKLVPGVAVSVTCVPEAKFAVQVPGQLMPAGVLVTVPEPEPADVTVRATLEPPPGPGPPPLTNPRQPARKIMPSTSAAPGTTLREPAMDFPSQNCSLDEESWR